METCHVCSSHNFRLAVDAHEIQSECQLRETFIQQRLSRPASNDELKDLTDFFHSAKAEILQCAECGLLVRREMEDNTAESYSEDEYNPAVMEHQYPSYLEAFRKKEHPYRALLPERARVVEVGSHYGAFLQTASEWGWQAEGIDVGNDTTRFARSKGYTVHQGELKQAAFPPNTFDGVFIWNCFEQIADARPLLQECRRVLKSAGLLVVRVPNAEFYLTARKLLRSEVKEVVVEGLGYNNLLGFPYLYGYRPETLQRVILPYGFDSVGMENSELLTLPLPENPQWVESEEHLISRELTALGPWIEVRFRCNNSSL